MIANQHPPFLEIDDPEIDAGELAAVIQKRVEHRRAQLGPVQRDFPTFGAAVSCPQQPTDIYHPPALYHHLRLVNELYGQPETAPILAASPATRIPILGRLWPIIREQAHSLVLFYVNRAVAHQLTVNRHVISTLNQLTQLSQEQQRTIVRLEQEIDRLRRERQQ